MKWKMAPQYRHQSGKDDHNIVFYGAPSETFSLSRKYTYPTLTTNNHTMGSKMKNLATNVYKAASQGWVNNLKTYAQHYYSEHFTGNQWDYIPPRTGFSQMIKAFFKWELSDPTHVDLESVVISDIVSLDADVRTVARMVNAGYLPALTGFDTSTLTDDIQ